MSIVKTAVSLDEGLFHRAEDVAHRLKISRSRLFAVALEEFMLHEESRRLLQQLNTAYAREPDAAEKRVERAMRRRHRRTVDGEW